LGGGGAANVEATNTATSAEITATRRAARPNAMSEKSMAEELQFVGCDVLGSLHL